MYKENIDWINNIKSKYGEDNIPSELKESIYNREGAIYDFESSVFEVLSESIRSEIEIINYIESLNERKKSNDFDLYCNSQIDKHMRAITDYGNQVYSLYSRDSIINAYQGYIISCQRRIDYNKNRLKSFPDDRVSQTALRSEEERMKSLKFSLSVLQGELSEMIYSRIQKEDVGHKIL